MKIGKVYKILYIGNENKSICYVGSTFNTLRDRFRRHKANNNIKSTQCSIFKYFEECGINNFKIFLIKEYEVADKQHLLMYEQLWINKLKPVNKNNSFQISRIYKKDYCQKNKERIDKYKKEYKQKNKEILQTKQKIYYQNNKDQKLKQSNEYYQKNKENILKKQLEKIQCVCGSIYCKNDKSRHEKTKKHQQHINLISN